MSGKQASREMGKETRVVDPPIPQVQCPRVILLGLGLKGFLDDSAIDNRSVDVTTLLAGSLQEILRGLLLRHCRRWGNSSDEAKSARARKRRGNEETDKDRVPKYRKGRSREEQKEGALKAYSETT